MLTSLVIKATVKEGDESPRKLKWQYSALDLLVFLQQALPGVLGEEYNDDLESVSIGKGSKLLPFRPSDARHWFFVAKKKGSDRFPILTDGFAWIKVGGRFIAIDPTSLYASDWGTAGTAQVLENPTYPTLRRKIADWTALSRGNTDKVLCEKFYKVAKGEQVSGMPDFLPVLISVLLVSEVARNHTAFHTNLMAIDLIREGAALPTASGSIAWTWENAIWINNACPNCGASGALTCGTCTGHRYVYAGHCKNCQNGTLLVDCNSCRGSGRSRNGKCRNCNGRGEFCVNCSSCSGSGNNYRNCGTCKARGTVRCGRCRGKGSGTVWDEFNPKGSDDTTVSGGGQALQNGLLPMSHMGSAFGSAFRLSDDKDGSTEQFYPTLKGGQDTLSKAPSPLTVVRRKEASILIQWLTLALQAWPDIEFEKIEETEESVESESVIKPLKVSKKVNVAVTIAPDMGLVDMDLTDVDFATIYDEVHALAVDSNFGKPDATAATDVQVKAEVRNRILRVIQTRVEMIGSLLS